MRSKFLILFAWLRGLRVRFTYQTPLAAIRSAVCRPDLTRALICQFAGADPSTDTATLEDVAKSVHDLREAVEEMRDGKVDREKVEEIAAEVIERQQAAAPEQNKNRGYQPDPELDPEQREGRRPKWLRGAPEQRFAEIHRRSAGRVAPVLGVEEGAVRNFQERADDLVLIATAMDVDPRETDYFEEEYAPALRAIDTQTTAEGVEWVPRELSGNLIDRVALELKVAALFPMVPMPTNPFDIPGKAVGRTRAGKATEQTADTGQTGFKKITPGTRKVTLTAGKFAGEVLVSKESEEDTIVALLPLMQDELVDHISADIEDCIINGDTSGTHQDGDVSASDDPRKNFAGLRKTALSAAKTDASNADLTVAMLRTNRKKMGKYGVNPANLAHILSINAYVALLADANVLTLDKYGPSAPILTGELGKADGAPLVVSEYARADLNASGVQDGTTTNRTLALTVHRSGFAVGERRGITVQVLRELYAEYDQDAIIATARKAFAARFTATTEPIVANTYNVKS